MKSGSSCKLCYASTSLYSHTMLLRKDGTDVYILAPVVVEYCDACKWISINDSGPITEITVEEALW